jgi:hypothetical protein
MVEAVYVDQDRISERQVRMNRADHLEHSEGAGPEFCPCAWIDVHAGAGEQVQEDPATLPSGSIDRWRPGSVEETELGHRPLAILPCAEPIGCNPSWHALQDTLVERPAPPGPLDLVCFGMIFQLPPPPEPQRITAVEVQPCPAGDLKCRKW